MKLKYFINCQNLDEIRRKYKELALLHHPDRPNGDTVTMQFINNEYEYCIKNPFFFNQEHQKHQEKTIHLEQFKDIIDKIICLPGIQIEICGRWIWVSGNSYPVRATLKAAGMKYARKKYQWYWHAPDEKKFRRTKTYSMQNIREKYGSDVIQNDTSKLLT